MHVEIFNSRVSDNFYYAIVDSGEVALVDPIDGSGAVDWLREEAYELRYLYNTHHHRDHVGGNPTVLGSFPGADLVAGEGSADKISEGEVDRTVTGGDRLELGDSTLEVLETPGHTIEHTSLLVGDHLLSGDLIFVAGAGNCNFGGDEGILFRTFRDVLSELGDEIQFYPGHDYSVRDLEFVLSIEPDNAGAKARLEEARGMGEDEIYLTTLGDERSYSPFFRYGETSLQEHLRETQSEVWSECSEVATSVEETAFRTVRALRDRW